MSKVFFKLKLTLIYLTGAVVARHIPDIANEWREISSSVSFQRFQTETQVAESSILNQAEEEAINRMLSSNEVDPSYTYQPIDSSTEYNQYQLAWHLLGYYVDCNSAQNYCSRYAMYAVVSAVTSGGLEGYRFLVSASHKVFPRHIMSISFLSLVTRFTGTVCKPGL